MADRPTIGVREALDPELVRATLDRITVDPLFAGSERLCRFLRYIVGETLEGRTSSIKESTIAVTVYGRPPDYDPKLDATVRVEAGRLRAKLAKYYAGEYLNEPVHIQLPKGTYVPTLMSTGAAVQSPEEARATGRAFHPKRKWGPWAGGLALVLCGTLFWSWRSPPKTGSIRTLTIAVLPFTAAEADPELSRFTAGFVRQLTTSMARADGFRVAGRVESDRIQAAADLVAVGKRLNVDAVIEGSAQRSGEGIHVTVQLVNCADGYSVWSQSYDSLPGRLAEFPEHGSNLIVRTLGVQFGGVPRGRLIRPISSNAQAVELYLKGRAEWEAQRLPGLLASVDSFRKALELDAGCSKAWEGFAASALFLCSLDGSRQAEWLSTAEHAARKAIALDNRLADAHGRLGNIYLRRKWRFAEAENELQFAVTLAPGSSEITRWYAQAAKLRRHDSRAREELEAGKMTNPTSEVIETELGLLEYEAGHYAQAEEHVARAMTLDDNYPLTHLLRGYLFEKRQLLAQAEAEYRRFAGMGSFGRYGLAALGHMQAVAGRIREAEEIAQRLETAAMPSLALAAVIYAGFPDVERALRMAEEAYARHDIELPLLAIDPRVRTLRREPRLRKVFETMGLDVEREATPPSDRESR